MCLYGLDMINDHNEQYMNTKKHSTWHFVIVRILHSLTTVNKQHKGSTYLIDLF